MHHDILTMPELTFWIWVNSLALLCLAALWFAFRNLSRARIIEDTPTSLIRSAHQGYVELNGTAAAMQGEPILTPLTHVPCCWYRYRIERRHEKGWRTSQQGSSDGLFLIKDPTGQCIIDPDGAQITPSERQVWYGGSSFATAMPARSGGGSSLAGLFSAALSLSEQGHLGEHYRYTEETIYPGDPLYAIGLFKSFDETDRQALIKAHASDLLRQWKQDHPELLARFDRNGDSRIDLDEWDQARRQAHRQATREEAAANRQNLHTLSNTGASRRPFIISSHAEFKLVTRYKRIAFAAISSFFLAGGIASWMLGVRLLS
ncbi:GIDE domain-containing protein [endosymbiont of Ridgeia piscesae]|jgi:hypothetical protein|uniref:RING-type E3 ubiquitin transferase n=1 Tax=endosymbiont of Ridgeia piscesae TaxID=54398 RepID=A0A0T5Z767_9GAMM|nr:GIDE domain-containing protein [endosymbiont of Ridgeia piscesae]KRT53689.1 E3 Ubiquitin ligase [endosymbiont of Ridgeia piscesae]KRT58589.1 E3 Ubiquitin ligase [endosymbiont of Ridgeia piscesae]